MNTTMERLMEQIEGVEEMELVDLGVVSEDTRGSIFGHTNDGHGVKLP